MQIKPGSRWRSGVCDGEIVIVRPPKTDETLACGGVPMKPASEPTGEKAPMTDRSGEPPLVGKRYGDEASGLEVLCNKAGSGVLTFGGRPLVVREAKKLPSSD